MLRISSTAGALPRRLTRPQCRCIPPRAGHNTTSVDPGLTSHSDDDRTPRHLGGEFSLRLSGLLYALLFEVAMLLRSNPRYCTTLTEGVSQAELRTRLRYSELCRSATLLSSNTYVIILYAHDSYSNIFISLYYIICIHIYDDLSTSVMPYVTAAQDLAAPHLLTPCYRSLREREIGGRYPSRLSWRQASRL